MVPRRASQEGRGRGWRRVNPAFLHMFVLFGPSVDGVRPVRAVHVGRGSSALLSLPVKFYSLLETCSQTQPEGMWDPVSRPSVPSPADT